MMELIVGKLRACFFSCSSVKGTSEVDLGAQNILCQPT